MKQLTDAEAAKLPIPEAFMLLADTLIATGDAPINGKMVHLDLGEWKVWVNGCKEEKKTPTGVDVPCGNAWIEYNGWPAGMISPFGGVIAAGSCANEQTFCEALERAKRGAIEQEATASEVQPSPKIAHSEDAEEGK